jgi:hypothetical protein
MPHRARPSPGVMSIKQANSTKEEVSDVDDDAARDGGTGSDKRFSPLLVRSNLGLSQSRSGSSITPSFRWNGFSSLSFAVFSLFALFFLSCSALRYPRMAYHAIATQSLLRLSGLYLDVIGPD